MRRTILFAFVIGSTSCLASGVAVAQLTAEQQLGEALYFDEDLSIDRNQSCASCHDPQFGFVDPVNVQTGFPVSEGSIAGLFGGLNAPSAAYAVFSPFFHWNGIDGLFVGGQFWNGRANSLAGQAAGPFLNPVEMAMPDKWAVVDRLRLSADPDYTSLFEAVYGIDLTAIAAYDWTAPAVAEDAYPPGVREVYDRMAKAIGEFEKTEPFTKFDSKFDYVQTGLAALTKE